MMGPSWAPLLASLLAAAVTTAGLVVIRRFEAWGRANTTYFACFAAGVLISVSFLHIVPTSFAMAPEAPGWLLAGYVVMHLLNRFLSGFVCDRPETADYAIGLIPLLGIGFHSFIDGAIYVITFKVSLFTGILAAVAIAAKDAVSNFIGAGILASDKPFKTGDRIEAGGLTGIVEEVGLRSTRLRTADGAVVVVPNTLLADGQVNNFGRASAFERQPIDLKLGVAIDTPRAKLDAFVDRLRAVFSAQPDAKPDVTVALTEIGPSSLDIGLSGAFAAGTDLVAARHKLLGDIVDLARETGVEFALPTSRVSYVGPASYAQASHGFGAQTAAE